ncbi:MAG: ABC transporter substrate-binding protein [Chloroflexota bacterium]|nr:ABC transporter substrate-binding protein [Chloroflexota bacterium]
MSHPLVGRRELLRRSLAVGATITGAGLLAACDQPPPSSATSPSASLPPPETATIRIASPFACDAPLWLAKDFLREEGFTDVQWVPDAPNTAGWITSNVADVGPGHPEAIVAAIDTGVPIWTLAGLHTGCQELWAAPGIKSVRDLRGKRIAVFKRDRSDQFFLFFSTLCAYNGIDPLTNVSFFEVGPVGYRGLLTAYLEGRSDAFLAAADGAAVLKREPRNPGTKILDQTTDKPWSQYLCCLLVANRDWARQNPNATKRFTRAVLRAADATAKDRAGAARAGVGASIRNLLAERTAPELDILTDTTAMVSYDWREYDPEETLRFFALRLGEVKLINSTPQQIITQGSDVAYMRQLRNELKP